MKASQQTLLKVQQTLLKVQQTLLKVCRSRSIREMTEARAVSAQIWLDREPFAHCIQMATSASFQSSTGSGSSLRASASTERNGVKQSQELTA